MPKPRSKKGHKSRKNDVIRDENVKQDENGINNYCNGEPPGVPPPEPTPTVVVPNLVLCRLCESKKGPFVQLFETEKVAKQVENLMPFSINKTDELPHTVCFRCCAKVDEIHEFIDKCVRTQENLHIMLGKIPPAICRTKTKERLCWERILMSSNKSHDDICDEVVKKAMQSMINTGESNNTPNHKTNSVPASKKEFTPNENTSPSNENAVHAKENILHAKEKKNEEKSRTSKRKRNKNVPQEPAKTVAVPPSTAPEPSSSKGNDRNVNKNNDKNDDDDDVDKDVVLVKDDIDRKIESLPFLNVIKVHGVGFLYQCNSCNRNFLNKNVVIAHSCVKNSNKLNSIERPAEPSRKHVNVPRPAVIKYITTSNNKTSDNAPVVTIKPKPKAGPASKTGRRLVETPKEVEKAPTTTFSPAMTNEQLKEFYSKTNSYILVPRPGNKFTLERKKPSEIENDNGLEIKKIIPGDKPHTVTSASLSSAGGSGSAEPYPVALFHIRKGAVGTLETRNEIREDPKPPEKDPGYSCSLCHEKFNRHQKLVNHLQSHYIHKDFEKKAFNEPKSKKRRTQ